MGWIILYNIDIYNMNRIISIVKRYMGKEIPIPNPIGRWKIETCNNRINNKIDLSNEDHCGPCGQYALDKLNTMNTNIKNTT
jgi:hypothetical protein